MSRAALRWGGALAFGALVAALVLWWGLRDEHRSSRLGLPGVGIASFLEPVSHRFADPVEASVETVLLPRKVDPGSVRLAVQFAPYRVTAARKQVRTERGVTSIRWTYRLNCLQANCRPQPGRARLFRFPPARVSFRRLDGTPGVRRQEWHALRSVSRLDAQDAVREDFQAREFPLPEISYRVEPSTLATGLVVAAALLALAGGALLWGVLSPLALDRLGARRFARLDPVQRQLLVLRDAIERSDTATQRRALDALSVSLEPNGNDGDELALGARRLAWSPRHGSPSDVLGFADEVSDQAEATRRERS